MTIAVERGALGDGGQISVDELSALLPELCPGLFTDPGIQVDRLNSRVFRVRNLSNDARTSVVVKRLPRGLAVKVCNSVRMIIKPDYHRSMRMVPAVPAAPAAPAPPAPPATPRYLVTTH